MIQCAEHLWIFRRDSPHTPGLMVYRCSRCKQRGTRFRNSSQPVTTRDERNQLLKARRELEAKRPAMRELGRYLGRR